MKLIIFYAIFFYKILFFLKKIKNILKLLKNVLHLKNNVLLYECKQISKNIINIFAKHKIKINWRIIL